MIFGNWMCSSENPDDSAKPKATNFDPSAESKPVITNPGKEKPTISTRTQKTNTINFQAFELDETAIISNLYPNYLSESFDESGTFIGVSKDNDLGQSSAFYIEKVEGYELSDQGTVYLVFWENMEIPGDRILEPVWEVETDSTTQRHFCAEAYQIRYGGSSFQWKNPKIESLLQLSDGTVRLTLEQTWTHEASNTTSSEKTMFLLDDHQMNWIFDYMSFEGYQDFLLKDHINSNKARLEKMIELIPNEFYTGIINETYSQIEFSENYTSDMPDLIVTTQSFELNDSGDEILNSETKQVWQFDGEQYIAVNPVES